LYKIVRHEERTRARTFMRKSVKEDEEFEG